MAWQSYKADSGPSGVSLYLRISFQVPSTWSLLAGQRLRYLSSFRKASPCLLALLQFGDAPHPWVTLVKPDLADLQSSNPKLQGMPPSSMQIDAWVMLAVATPKYWRKTVRAWLTPLAPVSDVSVTAPCLVSGKVVDPKGLGAHCARAHAKLSHCTSVLY